MTRNRPTIGAALVVFLVELLDWIRDLLPPSVPDGVVDTGYAFVVALVVVAIGQAVQRLGKTAPWAHDTHTTAVAYALTLDPDEHPIYAGAADEQMRAVGVEDLADARRKLGLEAAR